MKTFYNINESLSVFSSIVDEKKKRWVIDKKENGHLNLIFNYMFHRELHIFIGVHTLANDWYELDVMDLYGLSLPTSDWRYVIAKRHILRKLAVFSEVGNFKPLDQEFQQIIKNKRNQILTQRQIKRKVANYD